METTGNIRQISDGVWRWQCAADSKYVRRNSRVTITVCAAFCLLLLAFSAMLDMETMTITATCCAVVMLIAYLICCLFNRLFGIPTIVYQMTDGYIMTGISRRPVYFRFFTVQRVIISRNVLELRKRFGSLLVYVPAEDFEQVCSFILSRIPATAEVIRADETDV